MDMAKSDAMGAATVAGTVGNYQCIKSECAAQGKPGVKRSDVLANMA